jgi:hypothetical protein
MPKIYLSPAYHKWNPCSIDGCDETTHNNLYLDELEVFLKACSIEYKRGPRRTPKSDEDNNAYLKRAVKESNSFAPDIHYVSHTNASNSTVRGYRPMIYPGYEKAEKLAELIIAKRKEIYNQPVTLNKRTDLYELYATNSIAYYEEHVFHDNREDAQWFHNNMRKIAEQTCKAFCQYFSIPFVNPYEEKVEIKNLYRVRLSFDNKASQTGAFENLDNAIANAKENKRNVYDGGGNLVWEYKEESEDKTKEAGVIVNLLEKVIAMIKKLFNIQ